MEIHQLRYFIAVAEQASFSRAADRLRVAQPSLSQQIKKLEDEVGQVLFDRMPRRVALTSAGQRLLPFARQVLADIANARASVEETRGEISGPVVFGIIPTIAPYVLPELIKKARKLHPRLTLKIIESVTDDLVRALEDSELDLALISTCRPAPAFTLQRLGKEALFLLVPPQHRLAQAKAVSAHQLKKDRLLVLHESHCLSAQVARFCRRQGLNPEVSLEGSQLSTLAAVVATGVGVALVPEMSLASARAAGCIPLPFRGAPPQREMNLVTNPHRFQNQAVLGFKELIIERFRGKLRVG